VFAGCGRLDCLPLHVFNLEIQTMKHRAQARCVKCLCLAALALALAACETVQTTRSGEIGVDRKQAMTSFVSSSEVDQQASQEYAQILAGARKKGLLNQNPQQAHRVGAIAARLIPQVHVFRDDAPKWKWEVNVLTSKEVNAWCMPGGKIAVYTGLIEKLRLTDDELAAVMGHEIAHALREHARERMGRQVMTQTATGVGAIALEVFTGIHIDPQLAGTVSQAMFVLPNSRENEREADLIGIELAARAGYDPRAAIALWQKMAQAGGGGTPEWLSTHPNNETRLRDLQNDVQKVMPLYERAKPAR
jgi:predicted Zn-dependent protease